MNMTATSLKAQDTTPERAPLISVDKLQMDKLQVDSPQRAKLQSVQNTKESIGVKENKESLNQTAQNQMTTEEVKEMVESFQMMSETIQTKLSFSVNEENNKIVVSIFDKESEELIRQFPSEEMLALQDKMSDLAGFLFDTKA
ncbi:flagellar protein FlaG [uncultured Desulfobacter sp.]|uniref:flagellar protein FlaG n=1 Tax=uncultured Desulfobacter sp. TaxID=240139 RepID=UPI002AAA9F4F|nr:flagellar protein FlaG [uncultured Desulfobacter sp.]